VHGRAIVRADVLGHAALQHQLGQGLENLGRGKLPLHADGQGPARELVHDAEPAERAPVVGPVLDEVIGPDMVGSLGPEPLLSRSRPFLGCVPGTLSPSRRQMRSTRFLFTTQPAALSRAVMRRWPQRPFMVASSMMAAVSRSSLSGVLSTRRWVERGGPMTWQARRPDTPSFAQTCSAFCRPCKGLVRFPGEPPLRSACRA